MSEKLDYVNNRIVKAQEEKIDSFLAGHLNTTDKVEFARGYLKAMQDVELFQRDYASVKNPPRQEEEDEE